MAGYTKVQRADKGFDFFDNKGKKVDVNQYVQATGVNKNQLIQDLANSGDKYSQSFMRVPQQTRTNLFKQDADVQNARSSSTLNPLNFLNQTGKNLTDFTKTVTSGIQQGGAVLGDVALQGGAMLGHIGAATNPLVSKEQRDANVQRYDQNLIKDNSVTNQLRDTLHGASDLTGQKLVGTSDVDQNAANIANGRGSFRDYAAVAGKGLDTGLTATMFANPAAIARGATGKMTGRELLNFASKDALMYGGTQGAATGAQVYGQTGDLGQALQQGAISGALTGITQGALDGIGAGIARAPQAAVNAPQAARTVAEAVANPVKYAAKSDPRVTGFDTQYADLAQRFDSLPAGSPERSAISKAMAQNRQERLGVMRGVQREIGQGGYTRIPGGERNLKPIEQAYKNEYGYVPNGDDLGQMQALAPEKYAALEAKANEIPRQQTPSEPLRQSPGQIAPGETSPDTNLEIRSNPKSSQPESVGDVLQRPLSKSQDTPTINTNRYNVSDETKQVLRDTVDGLSNEITQRTGKRLSLKEVEQTADETTNILRTGKTREATLKATTAMQNARQKQAVLADKMSRGEALTPEEQADMVRLTISINTTKTDLARQLGSLRVNASPRDRNIIDVVLDKLSREIGDADAVAKAAKDYDLTDMRQLGEFYRSFIKATPEDWLDKLRYNSMLSSPVTHSRNIFANVTGSTIVAPAQKIFEGATDAAHALITGKQRTRYAGEAGHYASEYLRGMFSKQARESFKKAMKGELGDVNVDMNELYSLPLATKGFAGAMDKVLGFTTRLTDAVDQWAISSVRKGEEAGLKYRQSKGVDVGNIQNEALNKAEYRLFRNKLGNKDEGYVLRAIDFIPQKVLEATSSKNPAIRIPAKLTFPFVKTPTNVAKQMIEFSPLGLVTTLGAKDKTAAISKAIMGTTAIGLVTGTLAANDGLTFGLPTDPKEREKFLAEGKQAYSFKVGDKWFSYQYLHPAISFNMAAVASVSEAVKKGDMTDDMAAKVLEGVAGATRFFVDQSYFKNAQDFLSNMTADSFSDPATMAASYAKNVASQFVPFRALMTWVKNIADPVQRKVDTSQDVFKQFVDNFQKDLPGLSKNVGFYTDALGNPVKNTDTLLNAISPIRIKTEGDGAAQGETALDSEINRLYKVDEGIKLAPLTEKTDFNGVSTPLPTDQRKQLESNINDTTKKLWDSIVSDDRYKNLSDEDKRNALKYAKSDVTAAMKDRFASDYEYGQYASDFSGKESKLSTKANKVANGKLDAGVYLTETKNTGDTKLSTDSGSYSFLNDIPSMTGDEKSTWKTQKIDPKNQGMLDALNNSLPEGLPKFEGDAATNGIAEIYANYQKNLADKGWSELQAKREGKKLFAEAYKSQLTDNEKYISSMSDKDVLSAVDNGDVSKTEMDNIIKTDNILVKLGLTPLIGNKTRYALGYSGTSSSSSGGSKKGGITSAQIQALTSLNKSKTSTASSLLDLLSGTNVKSKSTPQTQKVALKKITIKG